ncbi:nucleobase:cation symporter-2 family protein [Mesorhizobium sp. NPDC059054]|uniref:nucleobase:cation symporter-2 family protein n=1 Tax=Mesorhizobium sp. NPDC059054 TaxID=3346711 RepID=UPI0036A26641
MQNAIETTSHTGRTGTVDPVDEIPPLSQLATLGLQHVLVMYAGAITVPLIVGGALGLSKQDISTLINADLLCCGIISIIQSLGVGRSIGIRLPIMMGVSYAGFAPMIAIGLTPDVGMTGLYGSIIAAGAICYVATPLIVRALVLFPPVVTGTTLVSLGVGLLGIATTWIGGGFGRPDFGRPLYLLIGALVVLSILLVARFARGFFANISVLVGIVLGSALAYFLGLMDFAGVREAPMVGVVRPFHFGLPTFHLIPVLTMTLVVLIAIVESIGLFFSMGEILQRDLTRDQFRRGLRADALGALIGGVFNAFPYTSYAQNIGLVGITGARSRFICVAGGGILIVLAFFPKVASVVASVPNFVLGGAALVMFGLIACSGIRILSRVDWQGNRNNGFVAAISLGLGMMPNMSAKIFHQLPASLEPFLGSGVILTAVSAVILNVVFNGIGPDASRASAVHSR